MKISKVLLILYFRRKLNPPMKMEQTECSETSKYIIQTPGTYPEESTQQIKFSRISYTFP
jgi:hypothetical protein